MSTTAHSRLPEKLIPSLAAIWVLIFVLGTIGHLQLDNPFGDSVFKSLQLFHLHYHPFPEAVAQAHHGTVPWTIEVARFAGALWGLALLPLLVVFLFEERVHRWWVGRLWKGHYVVCGGCQRAQALVRDLRRQRRRVVLVGRCSGMRDALPPGVLYLEGDSGDPEVLKKSAVHRAAQLIAMHEEDRANVETLVAAGRLCVSRSAKDAPLNAFAHITDPSLAATLQQMRESGEGQSLAKVREHFFNYYELIARLLVRRFPLPPTLAESRPPTEHIVIIGFAAFGQCVARQTIKMAQQLYRERIAGETKWQVAKPRITVVDPCAESLIAEFEHFNPHFGEFCDLDHHRLATTDARFHALPFLTRKEPGTRTTLVFCLETELVTLRTISLISALSRSVECPVDRIFLRIAQPERLGHVLEKLKPASGKPEIIYFAPDSEVFNADVILNQKLDVLAREIHIAYLSVEAADRRANNQPPAAGKKWDELSENDHQSNREAADHLWAKLHVLGYDLEDVPAGAPNQAPSPDLLRQLKEREEEIARAEHYRWMTWRVLSGWSWGDPRDNAKKLHPDIRDYDDLAEPTKEKDRVNIRVIPKLLAEGRLKAVPQKRRK